MSYMSVTDCRDARTFLKRKYGLDVSVNYLIELLSTRLAVRSVNHFQIHIEFGRHGHVHQSPDEIIMMVTSYAMQSCLF
jgi:hypothetical protein